MREKFTKKEDRENTKKNRKIGEKVNRDKRNKKTHTPFHNKRSSTITQWIKSRKECGCMNKISKMEVVITFRIDKVESVYRITKE